MLLADSGDRYVPRDQFCGRAGRIFTVAEQAQNQCQVGNIARSLRVIADWIALVPQAYARDDRRTGGASDVGAD